jgi:hypothetical protein
VSEKEARALLMLALQAPATLVDTDFSTFNEKSE